MRSLKTLYFAEIDYMPQLGELTAKSLRFANNRIMSPPKPQDVPFWEVYRGRPTLHKWSDQISHNAVSGPRDEAG